MYVHVDLANVVKVAMWHGLLRLCFASFVLDRVQRELGFEQLEALEAEGLGGPVRHDVHQAIEVDNVLGEGRHRELGLLRLLGCV